MDARDFVNSQPVYFTNSEQEAIHIPGFIQTHGILLVLQEPQLKILQASKNTEQFFGISASSLINQDLTTLFRQFQIDILAYCLSQENIEIFNPIQFSLECQQKSWLFECAMHRHDGVLIFELEPAGYPGYPYQPSSLLFYHLFKSSYYQIKKLWGLIACHHYSPKYINYEIRKTCELLGQLMPIELVKNQRKSEDKSDNLIELIQDKLSLSVPQEKSFIRRFYGINSTTLLELVNAEGVAL